MSAQVAGVHPVHFPQSSGAPQPSSATPQAIPRSAQVFGTQCLSGGCTQLVMSNIKYARAFSWAVNVELHSCGKLQFVVFAEPPVLAGAAHEAPEIAAVVTWKAL